MRPTHFAIAATLLVGACGPEITLTDDIDLTWDFGITLDRFDDTLHTPYVKGTPVTMFVSSSDDHPNLSGWSLQSTNPEVFRIDDIETDDYGLTVHGLAVGGGECDAVVLDDHGKDVGAGHVTVLAPDRIELDANAYLIVEPGHDDVARVDDPRILENGTATFLVRYFHGSQELFGNQVLTVDGPPSLEATPEQTFFFENREWLAITPFDAQSGDLQLSAGGDPVQTVHVEVATEADLDHVVMHAQSEKHAHEGDWLVALAQSIDHAGNRVFGVDYDWDVDGVQQLGEGDLFRYQFQAGSFQMVTANRAGVSGSVMIQADADTEFVDSSNNIGCSAGGTAGGGMLALVTVALELVRRRRPRAAS